MASLLIYSSCNKRRHLNGDRGFFWGTFYVFCFRWLTRSIRAPQIRLHMEHTQYSHRRKTTQKKSPRSAIKNHSQKFLLRLKKATAVNHRAK